MWKLDGDLIVSMLNNAIIGVQDGFSGLAAFKDNGPFVKVISIDDKSDYNLTIKGKYVSYSGLPNKKKS